MSEQEINQPMPDQATTDLVPAGSFATDKSGLSFQTLQEAWWFAKQLSGSCFVPDLYRGKPGDCLVAMDLALRLKSSVLAVLQNTYVVHGRPGMEAKFVLGLINSSGLFTDPLDYEVVGDDPFDRGYRVRAYALRKSTGKALYGPWITWQLVEAEGWHNKKGTQTSKWMTMPDVMFHYRAASWFANRHCPELKLGMHTVDELADIGERKAVESTDVTPKAGNAAVKEKLKAAAQGAKPPDPPAASSGTPNGSAGPGPSSGGESELAHPAPEMGDIPWDGPTTDDEPAAADPIRQQWVCTKNKKHVFNANPGEKCPTCLSPLKELELKF